VRSHLQDCADDLQRHAGVFGIVRRSLASFELGDMANDELLGTSARFVCDDAQPFFGEHRHLTAFTVSASGGAR
jgi:hypothetical protein